MKTLAFAWRYLWSRPMAAALNVLLLSLGLASITFLMLVGHQLNKAFERDLAGIDVVVGAKGSPMQLILSGVFHIDVPPGNVPLKAVRELEQHPMVESVIPISLGDNLRGFRIVGTSHAYIHHYGATLAQGRLWDAPMQVVVGATAAQKLGLALGNTFTGAHGLGAGGHEHGDSAYLVTGILAPSGSVLDRLVLTDTASVWKVHEDYTASADDSAEDRKVMEEEREVTLALIHYKTPMAAMSFPRYINTSTEMQAAAPALEITRLLNMLGIGTDVLRTFAGVLLLTAGLSVFIALWSAVRARTGDLALLRMLVTVMPWFDNCANTSLRLRPRSSTTSKPWTDPWPNASRSSWRWMAPNWISAPSARCASSNRRWMNKHAFPARSGCCRANCAPRA